MNFFEKCKEFSTYFSMDYTFRDATDTLSKILDDKSESVRQMGILNQVCKKTGIPTRQKMNLITAWVQIANRGCLTPEEMRARIGDLIPGATSIAAKALNVLQI